MVLVDLFVQQKAFGHLQGDQIFQSSRRFLSIPKSPNGLALFGGDFSNYVQIPQFFVVNWIKTAQTGPFYGFCWKMFKIVAKFFHLATSLQTIFAKIMLLSVAVSAQVTLKTACKLP